MKELELKVSGMHCSGCENRIKNSVLDIKGIKEVSANHVNGKVTVISKKDIDEKMLNDIKDRIERMDFKVEG